MEYCGKHNVHTVLTAAGTAPCLLVSMREHSCRPAVWTVGEMMGETHHDAQLLSSNARVSLNELQTC